MEWELVCHCLWGSHGNGNENKYLRKWEQESVALIPGEGGGGGGGGGDRPSNKKIPGRECLFAPSMF